MKVKLKKIKWPLVRRSTMENELRKKNVEMGALIVKQNQKEHRLRNSLDDERNLLIEQIKRLSAMHQYGVDLHQVGISIAVDSRLFDGFPHREQRELMAKHCGMMVEREFLGVRTVVKDINPNKRYVQPAEPMSAFKPSMYGSEL